MAGIAALRNAARTSFPAFRMPKDTFTANGGLEQSITKSPVATGGRNRFIPDPSATGAHTVFRRDPITQAITRYATFKPQINILNPNPWSLLQRSDGPQKIRYHYNKFLDKRIYTPHVQDPAASGGVRVPYKWEIPNA